MKALKNWLNKDTKPQTKEIQSTVNEGEGMTFNEKAEHIFKQIKAIG